MATYFIMGPNSFFSRSQNAVYATANKYLFRPQIVVGINAKAKYI